MLRRRFDPLKPLLAVLYLRMSSDDQNPRSPQQQRDTIEAALRRLGYPWVVVDAYADEAVSGRYLRRRAGFQQMLSDIRTGKVKVDVILVDTFERVAVEPITPALHETINGFAHAIAEHPMELLPQVADTLDYLAGRHNLILMTKGHFAEQSGKVERSGLKQFFSAVEIVIEKDAAVYREIIAKYDLPSPSTWMIGNSPKSDINPALAAGINAVFVPHGNTWVLEHEELAPPPPSCQLLRVETFAELRQRF